MSASVGTLPPSRAPPGFVPFGPHANCTLEVCPVEASVYQYLPSLAANGAFIAVYGLAAIVHVLLGLRWRGSWWFVACMVVGSLDEIVGYSGRVVLHSNPFDFSAFMAQI